jgi:hypothetical protein
MQTIWEMLFTSLGAVMITVTVVVIIGIGVLIWCTRRID